ncbi:MAG: glycine zipper 2TM domain-containing protein, partial [Rhodoferax sp.]
MKKLVVLSALLAAAGLCSAQEVGRVISSTPVVQQVAIPHQVCGSGQVVTQAPTTGAGAVIGAIAGGVMGNAIGAGSGRAAATAIGALGGAVVGNSIEASGQTQVQNV